MGLPGFPQVLQVAFLFYCLHKSHARSSRCLAPDTIDYNLRQEYCDQPLFVTLFPKSEESQLIDNMCFTFFPLPDDPTTFTIYEARVFCDGSHDIKTLIGTETGVGQATWATPFETLSVFNLGYAGCDSYIVYACEEVGAPFSLVLSLSTQCKSIGLSCLRKVQDIISERGLHDVDFHVMPNKLPNRCVTQQLCIAPPNPFYNKLPTVALY